MCVCAVGVWWRHSVPEGRSPSPNEPCWFHLSLTLSLSLCIPGWPDWDRRRKRKKKEVCAVHYSSHNKRVRASLKKEKSASMCGNTVWDVVPLWTRASSFSKEAHYSFLHPPFPLSKLTTTCVQPPILTTKISIIHRSWIKEMMMETTGAFSRCEETTGKNGDVLEGVRRPRFMA